MFQKKAGRAPVLHPTGFRGAVAKMQLQVRCWVVLVASCVACQRPATKPVPSASASAASTRPVALLAGGFDLTSVEGGAALVVADPSQAGLSLTLFDEAGAARPARPLFDAKAPDAPRGVVDISEVAAAGLGTDLAVVWLEKSTNEARGRGILRRLIEPGNAPLVDLGAMLQPVSTPRGNLAIGSSEGRFLVLARGQKTACVDPTQGDCVGFDFFRLAAGSNAHPGPPLAVPLPCAQNSVSFAVSGGRWYYGVCSLATGKPLTTLFSIQNEPAYARADRVLEGCLPMGAVADGDSLVIIGDCAGTRRGVRVRGGNARLEDVGVEHLDAVCEAGQPLIRQLGAGGLHLSLGARQDRLEAFLPANYSLPQARAVWTGQTLMVAGLVGGRVALKGYRCDSTLLREVVLARSPSAP